MKPPKKGPSPKVRLPVARSLKVNRVITVSKVLRLRSLVSQDIAAALEIEKNCLFLMSRETVTELANLKVNWELLTPGLGVSMLSLEQQCVFRRRKGAISDLLSCTRIRLMH